jgi:hypothetical protein
VDALNECPNTSGLVSRERVLELVVELVELCIPNLRICVTGRPEADVVAALGPWPLTMCLFMTRADKRRKLATSSVLLSARICLAPPSSVLLPPSWTCSSLPSRQPCALRRHLGHASLCASDSVLYCTAPYRLYIPSELVICYVPGVSRSP